MKSIKKHGLKFVAAAGILAATFTSASNIKTHSGHAIKCIGDERWMVKTLQDDSASKIKLKSAKEISVAEILKMKRAEEWKSAHDNPRLEDEYQVYTVRGKIPYVQEEDDGDIHIEIDDENNPDLKMIAEIPNPDCPITKKSEYRDMFRKTRDNFLSKYQDKSVWSHGTFEFTGVLFHDVRNHTKYGGNQEGVELHPLISIKKLK